MRTGSKVRRSRIVYRFGLAMATVLLGLAISLSVWGDSSTLTISNSSVSVTGASSATLNFTVSRSSDLSYDAFVQFQTIDGTAKAGTDYTAAMGSLMIPANASSATIPVTITGSSQFSPDKSLQMLLLGGGSAARGFTASFADPQPFATGAGPFSVTAADLNGDGKPDLIVTNEGGDDTLSVLLNTTAPGATTASFASQQTLPPAASRAP